MSGYPSAGWMAVIATTAILVSPVVRSTPEHPLAEDARLRVVPYSANAVTPITLYVGFHLHLEFGPDEQFVSLGAGDTSVLDVAAEANHLFLKARQPSAPSNITILTNRHVYYFDYRVVSRSKNGDEPVYSIRFSYPPPLVGHAPDRALDNRLSTLSEAVYRDYWFSGPASLRPSSAADDGLQLRLTFPPQMELPTVYVANPDGDESLVNSHFEHDTLVIHRLADRFVLRRGKEVACLVDRNDRGSQRRATNGTVNDEVDRHTRETPR